jgi:two-component system phosphate regulon sensor histidine kinase PhoR
MGWLLSRIVSGVIALLLGGALGFALGSAAHAPVLSSLLGGALGVSAVMLADSLRGEQLEPAPRDAGVWGEVGNRIERALRLRELHAANERTRLTQLLSAIEASPNGVLLLDADDQIEWCNRMAAEHFGLEQERDRRQPVTNLVRAPAFVEHLQQQRFDAPVRIPSRPGPGTLSVLIRPYGDGAKLVLSQDVTEAERTDAMRRDFVANVSHEIRSPLTVLSGFVETLATVPLTEVERTRVLELMRQQADRMQTLVGDLLTLAQLEGSPRPPADRWVPVHKLFAHVGADALALSAGRHRIVVEQPPATAQIAGAEAELLSAIGNVANNAVRYTPPQGEIGVRWVSRADGGGMVEVRDTGIGIAAEHIGRITERFYRVDSSRSRETGGTGLGLSIVKHVLQRHSGELECDSELGRGSTFRLLLPASRVRYLDVVPAAAEPADASRR